MFQNFSESEQESEKCDSAHLWCGHDAKALTDASRNTCTLAAKSETQQRSVGLKYISVQRQRNKLIILRVGGSCFGC